MDLLVIQVLALFSILVIIYILLTSFLRVPKLSMSVSKMEGLFCDLAYCLFCQMNPLFCR